jgi:hypothetical protein
MKITRRSKVALIVGFFSAGIICLAALSGRPPKTKVSRGIQHNIVTAPITER